MEDDSMKPYDYRQGNNQEPESDNEEIIKYKSPPKTRGAMDKGDNRYSKFARVNKNTAPAANETPQPYLLNGEPSSLTFAAVPPPKPKAGAGGPLLMGVFIFVILMSAMLFYYVRNPGDDNEAKTDQISIAETSGELIPIHTDSNFAVFDEKTKEWVEMDKENIGFGKKILTDLNSLRNIFSVNLSHSIRADKSTTFKAISTEPAPNFNVKFKLEMEQGRMWIDSQGDIFEIETPQGTVLADGNVFQTDVQDGSVTLYSWTGNLIFTPKGDKDPIDIKEGHMLFVDSMGTIIPPPPNLLAIEDKKTPWQEWNNSVSSDVVRLDNPVIPVIASDTTAKPVSTQTAGKETVSAAKEAPIMTEKESHQPPPPAQEKTMVIQEETAAMTLPKLPAAEGQTSYPQIPQAQSSVPVAPQTGQPHQFQPPPPQPQHENQHNYRPPQPPHDGGKPHQFQPSYDQKGKPPAYSSKDSKGSQSESKSKSGIDVLSNPNLRERPPGFGLHDTPTGPSEN